MLNEFKIELSDEELVKKISNNLFLNFSTFVSFERNKLLNDNIYANCKILKKYINEDLKKYFINNLSAIFLLSNNEFEEKIKKLGNKKYLNEEELELLIYTNMDELYIPEYLRKLVKEYNLKYSNLLLYIEEEEIINIIKYIINNYGKEYVNTINILFARKLKLELLYKNNLLNNMLIMLNKDELAYKINTLNYLNKKILNNNDLYIDIKEFEKKYNIDIKKIRQLYKDDFRFETTNIFNRTEHLINNFETKDTKKKTSKNYEIKSADNKSSIKVTDGVLEIDSPYLDIEDEDFDFGYITLIYEVIFNDIYLNNNRPASHKNLDNLLNEIKEEYPLLLYLKNEIFLTDKIKKAILLYQKISNIGEYGKEEANLFYKELNKMFLDIEKSKYTSNQEYKELKKLIKNIR